MTTASELLDYPVEVSSDEPIVRVVRTPHFYKNNGLTAAAFRPQVGSQYVSVIRWLYRPEPDAAVKAICHQAGNSGTNTYCGIAVLAAAEVLASNAGIVDDRTDAYRGHAHIVHPVIAPRPAPGEPTEGPEFVTQTRISNALKAQATYIADPNPQTTEWTINDGRLPMERR